MFDITLMALLKIPKRTVAKRSREQGNAECDRSGEDLAVAREMAIRVIEKLRDLRVIRSNAFESSS
jgi:hypothetical protein